MMLGMGAQVEEPRDDHNRSSRIILKVNNMKQTKKFIRWQVITCLVMPHGHQYISHRSCWQKSAGKALWERYYLRQKLKKENN